MARAGYRIFDADTHIIEPVEPIEAYLSSADRAKLAAFGPAVQRAPAKGGMSRYQVGKRPALDRRLGSRERVEPPTAVTRGVKDGGTPWDVRWQGPPFPSARVSFDAHARVRDMDIEGVDVNMVLPSGGVPAFCALDDVALELAMYEAYHRFLKDYCAPYPDRLTSVILVSGRDVAASVAEVRLSALEGGHGWLASGGARLDELAEMCRHALPPLKHKPSEYIRGPQYFQSIQIHEGEQSLRHAIEALGEDTLMFATDYPHSESWFPKSVEMILGWTSLSETAKRKLLWENAVRCYRRCGAPAAAR